MSFKGDPKAAAEVARAEEAGFPYSGCMAIAVTNKRLLIYERGRLLGGLKDYLGDFSLDHFESVRMSNQKGMGDMFMIRLKDGKEPIRIYGVRKDDTKEFNEKLQECLKATSS